MSLASIPTFLTACFLFLLGAFVLVQNRRSEVNISFALICVSSSVWLFSYSQAYGTTEEAVASNWLRIGYIGVIFIAITYYHFSTAFLGLKKAKIFVFLSYLVGVVFVLLFRNTNFFIEGVYRYFWGFYPKAGHLHPLFLVFFLGLLNIAVGQIGYFYFFKKEQISSTRKQQFKYSLLALGIYTIASVDFIPNYGIEIFPFGFIPASIFLVLMSFSIVKYRLMDISLAITRTGLFIVVYSLVLGIPFALAFGWREQLQQLIGEMWWLVPLVSSAVLATVGPSIYFFIQQKAEDRILQEQRRYQTALRRASVGMGRVKDLKRLLKLTVNIITRTVRIEHCEIYLSHKLSERYILKASQGWSLADDQRISFIPADAPLVQYLKRHPEPLVYDEVKQRGQDFKDQVLEEIGKVMEELDAALLVPSFIEEDLIAILVLGRKRSGKLYSHDDLIVFSILANQAALAIENAQFYEDMQKTHDQLMKAEKMATIGTMADGLSHQINNRLHAMGFIASDALDTIKLQPKENLPPEAKKVYAEMEVSLGKIQENVKRGGEIVEGLLKYSRKTDEGFTAVDLGKLLDAALEMAQFKIKLNQIDIARDFNGSIARCPR